jgi:hypothetical protein
MTGLKNGGINEGQDKYLFTYIFISLILFFIPYYFLSIALPIGIDSGVFMYTGMLIHDGLSPYINSWDHKGPLIYIFNALGYSIFGGASGVILLEGLLFSIMLIISMRLWAKYTEYKLVVLGAILFALYHYHTFEGGNMTETWYVPFSLFSYSLAYVYFCSSDDEMQKKWAYLFSLSAGITIAVGLLTRLNNVLGLSVLFLIFLLFQGKYFLRYLLCFLVALIVIVLPIIFYLFKISAIDEFLQQYIYYNLYNSSIEPALNRIVSFFLLFYNVISSSLGFMLVVVFMFYFSIKKGEGVNKDKKFIYAMIVTVIVEFLSQMISGRGYLHYISLLSSSMILLFIASTSIVTRSIDGNLFGKKARYWLLLLLPLIAFTLKSPIFSYASNIARGVSVPGSSGFTLTKYLQAHSQSGDYILIYGTETWLLVASDRRSPTSITYYFPALSGFNNTHKKYYEDVISNPPLYIVKAPGSLFSNRFNNLYDFMHRNYRYEALVCGYEFWRHI